MAGTNVTLDGLAKRIFGELIKTLPDFALVQELMPFQSRAKTGEEYEVEVVLSRSHGVTFQRTSARTVYSLNEPRTMQTEPARTAGSEITFREQAAYGMIAAAEAAGERAYEGALPLLMGSVYDSHRFYLELLMLYGNSPTGIMVIESHTDATTTGTLTATSQSWATGIWSQMEGAAIDIYNPTLTTKRNGTGPITVGRVDADSRTYDISGDEADLNAIVNGDVVVPIGAKGETLDGIDKQLTNTGSLFGINAATYGLWQSNVLDAGSAPATMALIMRGLKLGVGRGLISKSMTALVNESVFADIANNAAALRTFTESQKMGVEQGTHKLTFAGSNNNMLELVSHPMVKQGDIFIVNPRDWIRGGEADITNGLPGKERSGERFFFDLPSSTGKEFREFSSQFLMGTKPSQQVKISNIASASAI